MLKDNIRKDILEKELAKDCVCECCRERISDYLYIYGSGVCITMAQVCGSCKNDLFDLGMKIGTYEFLIKISLSN